MLNLLQPIAGLAGQWMANRAEKAKAKQALAVAKIEAKTKRYKAMRTGKSRPCLPVRIAGRMKPGR